MPRQQDVQQKLSVEVVRYGQVFDHCPQDRRLVRTAETVNDSARFECLGQARDWRGFASRIIEELG